MQIFEKLSHNISEVRDRALNTISLKLSTGVLKFIDLASDSSSLSYLLGWMRVSYNAPLNEIMLLLDLLLRLSKDKTACALLNSLQTDVVIRNFLASRPPDTKTSADPIFEKASEILAELDITDSAPALTESLEQFELSIPDVSPVDHINEDARSLALRIIGRVNHLRSGKRVQIDFIMQDLVGYVVSKDCLDCSLLLLSISDWFSYSFDESVLFFEAAELLISHIRYLPQTGERKSVLLNISPTNSFISHTSPVLSPLQCIHQVVWRILAALPSLSGMVRSLALRCLISCFQYVQSRPETAPLVKYYEEHILKFIPSFFNPISIQPQDNSIDMLHVKSSSIILENLQTNLLVIADKYGLTMAHNAASSLTTVIAELALIPEALNELVVLSSQFSSHDLLDRLVSTELVFNHHDTLLLLDAITGLQHASGNLLLAKHHALLFFHATSFFGASGIYELISAILPQSALLEDQLRLFFLFFKSKKDIFNSCSNSFADLVVFEFENFVFELHIKPEEVLSDTVEAFAEFVNSTKHTYFQSISLFDGKDHPQDLASFLTEDLISTSVLGSSQLLKSIESLCGGSLPNSLSVSIISGIRKVLARELSTPSSEIVASILNSKLIPYCIKLLSSFSLLNALAKGRTIEDIVNPVMKLLSLIYVACHIRHIHFSFPSNLISFFLFKKETAMASSQLLCLHLFSPTSLASSCGLSLNPSLVLQVSFPEIFCDSLMLPLPWKPIVLKAQTSHILSSFTALLHCKSHTDFLDKLQQSQLQLEISPDFSQCIFCVEFATKFFSTPPISIPDSHLLQILLGFLCRFTLSLPGIYRLPFTKYCFSNIVIPARSTANSPILLQRYQRFVLILLRPFVGANCPFDLSFLIESLDVSSFTSIQLLAVVLRLQPQLASSQLITNIQTTIPNNLSNDGIILMLSIFDHFRLEYFDLSALIHWMDSVLNNQTQEHVLYLCNKLLAIPQATAIILCSPILSQAIFSSFGCMIAVLRQRSDKDLVEHAIKVVCKYLPEWNDELLQLSVLLLQCNEEFKKSLFTDENIAKLLDYNLIAKSASSINLTSFLLVSGIDEKLFSPSESIATKANTLLGLGITETFENLISLLQRSASCCKDFDVCLSCNLQKCTNCSAFNIAQIISTTSPIQQHPHPILISQLMSAYSDDFSSFSSNLVILHAISTLITAPDLPFDLLRLDFWVILNISNLVIPPPQESFLFNRQMLLSSFVSLAIQVFSLPSIEKQLITSIGSICSLFSDFFSTKLESIQFDELGSVLSIVLTLCELKAFSILRKIASVRIGDSNFLGFLISIIFQKKNVPKPVISISVRILCQFVLDDSVFRSANRQNLLALLLPSFFKKSSLDYLSLLCSLTTHSEGQTAVYRVLTSEDINLPDISLFIKLASSNSETEYRMLSLIFLRNLCFLPTAKALLLDTSDVVSTFLSALSCNILSIKLIAVDALWILIYNSASAKTMIRKRCGSLLLGLCVSVQQAIDKYRAESKPNQLLHDLLKKLNSVCLMLRLSTNSLKQNAR